MATKKQTAAPTKPKTASVYTQLWPQHVTAKLIGVVDGQPLERVFSWWNKQSDFSHSRITVGDVLVPVHIVDGALCPIARMTVSFKGTVATWNAGLDRAPIGGAHHAETQLLVGEGGTPQHFRRPLPIEVLRGLRYDAKQAPRPLKLKDDGRLQNHLGVDGVFRLTPESGDELLWLSWI